MQKRILTIQDYSCLGRCSLTVAIPTISSAGIEAISIPTAILSNHTAFSSWSYLDMTSKMEEIVSYWDKYNHSFDSIYTGYLSNDQIPTVINIINKLKEDKTKIFVDPAMADNGKLYPGFDNNHVIMMRKLISISNIAIPNLTEACLLLDRDYNPDIDNDGIKDMLLDLSKLGPSLVVISGIRRDDKIIIASYNKNNDEYYFLEDDLLPGIYHGTGDLFSSAFISCLENDINYKDSIKISHEYVYEAIKCTLNDNQDGILYGVQFEKVIPEFVTSIKKHK